MTNGDPTARTEPTAKSFAMTEEGRIAYVQEGRGPGILLIHGIPTSSFLWRGVIAALEADFSVSAVDLLGYGDSDKPETADLSIGRQAEYLRTFMEKVGWEAGAVVGHDIGGGIAQLLAVRYPNLVSKLVLLDTIAYDSWPVPEIDRLKDPAWDQILESLDLAKGLRKALERGMFHKERIDDELVSAYVRPFQGVEGRRAYLRAARALRTKDLMAVMDQVERLEVPTLIIWGQTDVFQSVEYGRRLETRMDNVRLVVLPEAGHFTPEDQPEAIAALIREHCSS